LICLEYNDNLKQKWIDFVEKNPKSCLYHDILWKDILEKSYSLKSRYIICLDDSKEIIGILPLFEIKNILGNKYLVSIPYFTSAGLCVSKTEAIDNLLEKSQEISKALKAQYVELRHLNNQSIKNLPSRLSFTTSLLKLDKDENNIWKDFITDSARRNIKKALRSKLTIETGDKYIDDFYKVYSYNMRDLGTPVMSHQFFINIVESFKERAKIVIIRRENEAIAGMLLIKHKLTLYDPFVSSLREYNDLRPNNLLYWEAIKFGVSNNLSYFDLGRSTIGTGLFNFKSQWGASHIGLSYQYLFNKSSHAPVCDAINNKYQLAIKIWKKLPICFTNFLGPKLIPFLPEL